MDALLRRLEILEQAVANGATAPPRKRDAELEVVEQPTSSVPEAAQKDEEPAGEGDGGSEEFYLDWGSVMRELRGRRQVPAAAFYENARVAGYEDGVLEVIFPKSMETLVAFAGDPKHMKPLQEVLEERLGTRPRIEFGVDDVDGGAANPSTARARQEAKTRNVPGPRAETRERSKPRTEPVERESRTVAEVEPSRRTSNGGETARRSDASAGPEPDASSGSEPPEGVIQNPQEVFALAREWFPPRGKNLPDSK